MKLLEQYFDDALYHPPEHGEVGIIEVNRDRKYDGSVALKLGIDTEDQFQHVLLFYHLHILPIFMEFQSEDKLSFPLDSVDRGRVSKFIDDKITYFVETYIRFQENPHYQKPCVEIDPVCGKSFDCNHSTVYVVFKGKKHFFCSTKCRDAFFDRPEQYA